MKRFGVAFTIVVLLITPALLVAAGGKPIIIQSPFTTPFVISAADSGCGFDILDSPQAGRPNKGKVIIFNNSQISSGPLFVTLQNLTSNQTVNVNVSGPGTFTFSDNTFVLRGPSLGVLPESVAKAAGLPLLVLANGQLTLTFDDLGNIISASLSGTAKDACQLFE